MEFNISKCKILQVSTHCKKSLFSYQMFSIPLEIVKQRTQLPRSACVYITECHGDPTMILFVIKQMSLRALVQKPSTLSYV